MYYCFYLLPFWFFYFKKVLLFTGEHPCWSVILIKFICKFIQIIHWQGCSPVFSSPVLFHIFRTPFYKNTSEFPINSIVTAWKVPKYEVISGLYFLVFGPEITPYLDAVKLIQFCKKNSAWKYSSHYPI